MGGNEDLWTRREFLVLSAGATGGVLLAACSPTATSTTTPTTAVTTAGPSSTVTTTTQPALAISDYWELLREAQRRIRTSPDHIAAQLTKLAAAGDVDGLTRYVRDHIAVIPADPGAWVANGKGLRWGTRGVLRSGMGTPREVAQVIADLLNAAGTEVTIVNGALNGSERPVLVPVEAAPFEVDRPIEELFAAAGSSEAPIETPADPALAEAMAAAALAAFDDSSFATTSTADLFGALPDVKIGAQVVGLWHAQQGPYDVDFGNTEIGPPNPTRNAEFTLLIATSIDPWNPIPVASASFSQEDLAGRRVDASFIPAADSLADLFTTRPADVTTVTPTLAVSGLGMTEDERASLFVAGDPFTIEGTILTEDGEGLIATPSTIPGIGATVVRVKGDGDVSRAAEIRIRKVVTAHYPQLTAEVDIVDEEGRSITGISAEQLLISDDGFEVPFLLRRTQLPPPSIVFIVDNSTSVPEQWRGQGAVRVVTEIATAVKAAYPDARFRIANVGLEGAGLLSWTEDPVKVGSEADQFGIGSALWDSYVDAAVPEANAIVFLTDGNSVTETAENIEDEAPADLIPQLLAGPPAIMLGSGDLGGAFQGIADITGGVAIPIEEQDAGIAAVLEQLDAMLRPYDILVLADEDNESVERTLRVSLPNRGLEATAAYEVPEQPIMGRTLGGLYLEVRAESMVVVRTLAGVPYRSGAEVTPEIAQEVRQALFGKYSVITEAGAPSPSQIFDDAVTSLLTWEAVATATDADAALEAFAAVEDLPHGTFTFAGPVSGSEGPMTWDTGLRMWLSSERTIPAGDGDILRRNVDLLPVSRFVTTTASDPVEAARLTALRTAGLAAVEAAAYEDTSAARLTDDLTEVNIGTVESDDREAFAAITNGWPGAWRLAFNEEFDSAVAADPRSGGLIAVLGDGTGGGITEEEIKEGFKRAIALAELGGNAGFKHWAELEKAKLKQLRFATLVIHRMSIEGILETIAEEVCDRLKKPITDWTTGVIGKADKELEGFIKFYIEKAKEAKRLGDAVGLFPNIPTGIKPC